MKSQPPIFFTSYRIIPSLTEISVGAATAAIFLEFNDLALTADPDAYSDLTLSVARGELGKPAIADFFRANTRPI